MAESVTPKTYLMKEKGEITVLKYLCGYIYSLSAQMIQN